MRLGRYGVSGGRRGHAAVRQGQHAGYKHFGQHVSWLHGLDAGDVGGDPGA